MENKPFQDLPPPQEVPMMSSPVHIPQMRNSVLPAYEDIPCQMSPFGDERWDLDVAENIRRKEIHREYVYNYRKPNQHQEPPHEKPCVRMEEPIQPVLLSPRMSGDAPSIEIERPLVEYEPVKKDYFKREPVIPKPKPLSDLKFDTPNPPNLYPVLKFPEKVKHDPVCNVPQPIPTFDKTGVVHYGVHVPFWQFSSKT